MRILITGGCGFVGCNTAAKYIKEGHDVVVLDNLSREGSKANLEWLRTQGKFEFIEMDIKASGILFHEEGFDIVFHFAAQVAVTKSIVNPIDDFITNAYGTLILLNAIQKFGHDPIFIYSSTNKVYGSLDSIEVVEKKDRYEYANNKKGITESQPLDFYSPYGCSKGCADQYVRDFARIYGMRTVVLRQSCIYGPRQFGIESQGWLAWLAKKAIDGEPIVIYGNGKQVRDVLYIDDLLDCYDRVVKHIDIARGEIYNIGGGAENQVSLLELLKLLEDVSGKILIYKKEPARQGDQRIYVSDISKAEKELEWSPSISLKGGLPKLYEWVKESATC